MTGMSPSWAMGSHPGRLHPIRWVWLGWLSVCCMVRGHADNTFFDTQVQPTLVKHCMACHGPDEQKGGLRLDLVKSATQGGRHGKVIIPGKPEKSPLIERIRSEDPDLQMPPKGERLSSEAVQALETWIQAGAIWPESESSLLLRHWAYQPIREEEPPTPRTGWMVENPIDLFIQAKLEIQGLTLNPPAEMHQLVRRMTLDLTGLPPTWEDLQSILDSGHPAAISQWMDHLLASPRYGERWGRHWLDVARFNESQGYERDKYRPHAWRYRDYVIGAFNRNKPYDQFVRDQIAGDVSRPWNAEGIIATGFLVAGPWDEVGANQVNRTSRKQVREDELEEMISTLGQTFLASTIHCARCHSHKYDPIPHEDYYRLKSALDGAHHGNRSLLSETEHQGYLQSKKALQSNLNALQERLKTEAGPVRENTQRSIRECSEQLRQLEQSVPMTYAANSRQPEVTKVLARGSVTQPGQVVRPGGLTMLQTLDSQFGLAEDAPEGQRRTALADWLTDPQNPLTARVMVNRIWHYHFGRGLVSTPNDFGQLGERPTHPELLDWLAMAFIRSGWDIKHMHRLILSSATYRQSSASHAAGLRKDPLNQWLWRFQPRRVEGEIARDAMLQASGELHLAMGGPGYKSYDLKVNNSHFYTWADHQGAPYNRRSVYRTHVQSANDPLMDSLDCPRPSDQTPVRTTTTTPLQALSLMNNSVVLRQAKRMAARLAHDFEDSPEQAVRQAFRRTLQRDPAEEELEDHSRLAREHGLEQVCWVLMNSSEFLYLP